jgi:hypothetical protein
MMKSSLPPLEEFPPEKAADLNDRDHDHDDHEPSESRSLSTTTSNSGAGDAQSESALIALRETKQICWLRGIVMVALLVATFMVSVVIFYSTRRSELEQFETQFGDHAAKLLDAFTTHWNNGISAVDNLGVSLTSYGKQSAFQWPFAIIPDFEVRAASTLNLAVAALISLYPLVEDFQQDAWESSALEFARDWVDAGIEYEIETGSKNSNGGYGNDEQDNSRRLQPEPNLEDAFASTPGTPVEFIDGIATQIYRIQGQSDETIAIIDEQAGPFYPTWQHAPVKPELVNYNLFSHGEFGSEAQVATDSQQVVIGQVSMLINVTTDNKDPFKAALDQERQNQPFSNIYFPVFSDYKEPRQMVALLTATIFWQDFLQAGNLPDSGDGIKCILANACGQSYTFQVEDQKVIYLQEGDHHDRHYDHLEEMIDLGSAVSDDSIYSGTFLNQDYCPFSLHVYPSASLEQEYYSKKPAIYTTLVVVVFLFTSLVFVGYDYLVERRQQVVMKSAVKSHQIVSSLFPAVVRNRLFGEEEEAAKEEEQDPQAGGGGDVGVGIVGGALRPLAAKQRIKGFLDNNDRDNSKPIADLFPHTTVCFADIAGFTAWSSVREPAQVFVLLETVYAAFDKLAAKRRVFKVETIGDCYVAVTGLPDPQPDRKFIPQ